MAKTQQNNRNPSIQITRSEDIDLPVYEPGGYKGIRVREWGNLRKAVGRLSSNNSRWETAFNISATSFFAFLIPALTTPGNFKSWRAFFSSITILSFGIAIPTYVAWRSEKSRTETDSKDVLGLMDEIDSFYTQSGDSSIDGHETAGSYPSDVQPQTLKQPSTAEDDELLQDAIRIAYEAGKVSTSMLQRKLRIGYGRAARIVDELEHRGIVGESDGVRPRTVISPE